MTASSWIAEAIGQERVDRATTEASRRRLHSALGLSDGQQVSDGDVRFVADSLELLVYDLLAEETNAAPLREAAAQTFQVARALPWPEPALDRATWLLKLGCLAVLGDRGVDFRRLLLATDLPPLPITHADWGKRVWASILEVWLRLLRKQGWDDLDAVQQRVAALRQDQRQQEPTYLAQIEKDRIPGPAWQLVAEYHLAKAAELLAIYLSQGSVEGHFDIRQQLEAQFDRAVAATSHGSLIALESLTRLLARTAQALVDNSIWTATRSINSRVTQFVETLTSRSRQRPILELLPPQRKTLREEGLLGSGYRSVVVSLPPSSGKTFIAQFRILQALNQFDQEQGWVAYLAPTRALVNQLAVRLRRELGSLGITVERVSPALQVDGLEARLLTDKDRNSWFRVLVTTPEKLDLMLRGGWEQEIGRPLTLVVVDEAHGISNTERGIKLELLLATINRECRHAQFLLLTPFVPNAAEIARWLAPDSNKNIELGIDWSPNDRAIVIAQAQQEAGRGAFTIRFKTQHTSKNTLSVPEVLQLPHERPLGLTWSDVANSQGKLAAATAEIISKRGTVIILTDKPRNSWGIARAFKSAGDYRSTTAPKLQEAIQNIQIFLAHEMGEDFPLREFLDYGVGVHHAGLSDDTRALVEWLTENNAIKVLVATTTIAQGVNFPVSGVVLASHQYPYGKDIPPEDFWNLAGRAGRVDQGDLGIVALVATDDAKIKQLEAFIARHVGALNSTLVEMVQMAAQQGELLQLHKLAWQPAWSSFLQYLAHTYRQIGNHEQFAAEIEQVLRGTLGFQMLRKSHENWAAQLVQGVYNYTERLQGKPLKLVDSTGFSWESVSNTLARLAKEKIKADVWSPELFSRQRDSLRKMMGILLQVPELQKQLQEVTGGPRPDGDKLARMICDWVQGKPLMEMASEYFAEDDRTKADPVTAMTNCCRSVFGRLTQTASWGLAALQSLTLGEKLDHLSSAEQRTLRNLPARVYYGVNTDEALALRLLGVPRMAAEPLAGKLDVKPDEPLSQLRDRLRKADKEIWEKALGDVGSSYRRVWSIIEGES